MAKALALGASHTTNQLDVLLAEPLLGETLEKVATLRSHGAHMRFKLQRLEVHGLCLGYFVFFGDFDVSIPYSVGVLAC